MGGQYLASDQSVVFETHNPWRAASLVRLVLPEPASENDRSLRAVCDYIAERTAMAGA
jgi:hypothetical protein